MPNFPKALTIKQLSDALKFENELFILADILSEVIEPVETVKTFDDEFREFLATKTSLNAQNIEQIIYFVSGLEKLLFAHFWNDMLYFLRLRCLDASGYLYSNLLQGFIFPVF